jgi:hypothetical protein
MPIANVGDLSFTSLPSPEERAYLTVGSRTARAVPPAPGARHGVARGDRRRVAPGARLPDEHVLATHGGRPTGQPSSGRCPPPGPLDGLPACNVEAGDVSNASPRHAASSSM